MSADNWRTCPACIEKAKELRDAFRNKYYGKLDSYVFTKLFEEIEKAVKHIESYSSEEFKPNEELLKLAEEKEIEVTIHDANYDGSEIMQNQKISCSLREDYETGLDEDGLIYIEYSCRCDCGFEKSFSHREKKGEDR